jgi:capsid protein
MHQFCAGVDLPRELLLKDFSNTNYSSARAALLEAWRGFVTSRDWLAGAWLQECYLLWLEEAVRLGEVEAPRFYENWFAYSRATWLGSGMIHIDPLKEAQSQVLKLQYNSCGSARGRMSSATSSDIPSSRSRRRRDRW